MPKFPSMSGREMLKFLAFLGFEIVRTKGSHYRLAHSDGRKTTVAVHGSSPLPVGTIHKIIRDDIGLDNDSFYAAFEQYNKR